MFPVQPIAQSGGRRIAVSVKILADFFGRKLDPGLEIQPVKSDLSIGGLIDARSCQKIYIRPRRSLRLDPAKEEIQSYCLAHPGSPSAVRRPHLSSRGDLWITLLGPSVEKGIVGIGLSVEAALRAFDTQYLEFLGPGTKATKIRDSAYRARNRAAQIQSGFCC